ncbi:hypothetical protein GCM10010289_80210 [Streptomyces violascens]|nr:hypothetical protein GCM10010289_80210 [Streptomyces violascens]
MEPDLARVRETGRLRLVGTEKGAEGGIAFTEDRDLVLHRRKSLPYHSNGMRLFAYETSFEGPTTLSEGHLERLGQGAYMAEFVGVSAVGGRWSAELTVCLQCATSRAVRTSRARSSAVARAGFSRSRVRTRQFFKAAKPCSTGARVAAMSWLACFCPAVSFFSGSA